jgi:hypothetical protein
MQAAHPPSCEPLAAPLALARQSLAGIVTGEGQATVAALQALHGSLRRLLRLDSDHLHAAIEARRPGGTLALAQAHEALLDALQLVVDEARALALNPATLQGARWSALKRDFAAFESAWQQHREAAPRQRAALLAVLYAPAEVHELETRLAAARACGCAPRQAGAAAEPPAPASAPR